MADTPSQTEELAENAGQKIIRLTLEGQVLTLRTLNLNDMVELEQVIGPLDGDCQRTAAGLRYQLYLLQKRGKTGLELEEVGGLVGQENTEEVQEALAKLIPSTGGNEEIISGMQETLAKLVPATQADRENVGKIEDALARLAISMRGSDEPGEESGSEVAIEPETGADSSGQ